MHGIKKLEFFGVEEGMFVVYSVSEDALAASAAVVLHYD